MIRKLDNSMVHRNYLQFKQGIKNIIQSEMQTAVKGSRITSFGNKDGENA